MLYGITLPPYEVVQRFEGKGNWALKKYYQFPFNVFYKKKFKMIIDHFPAGKIYWNILDFGGGPAEIFKHELGKRAIRVKSYDLPFVDPAWRFDVIVCASVLEFTNLSTILKGLHGVLNRKGFMVVASPMHGWASRLYFWLLRDKKHRHTHTEILEALKKYFVIKEYKTWLGLYFSCKVVHQ